MWLHLPLTSLSRAHSKGVLLLRSEEGGRCLGGCVAAWTASGTVVSAACGAKKEAAATGLKPLEGQPVRGAGLGKTPSGHGVVSAAHFSITRVLNAQDCSLGSERMSSVVER